MTRILHTRKEWEELGMRVPAKHAKTPAAIEEYTVPGYLTVTGLRYFFSAEQVVPISDKTLKARRARKEAETARVKEEQEREAVRIRQERERAAVLCAKIDPLLALWSLNRSAKRFRDTGDHVTKRYIYNKKGQALTHLFDEAKLTLAGYHSFNSHNEIIYSEILEGGGYRFHRPCPKPENADNIVSLGTQIEAKPVDAAEVPYEDALIVINEYLRDKKHQTVFDWPKPEYLEYCY